MNFFTRIVVLFYVTIVLFIGCVAVLFVLNAVDLTGILNLLTIVYFDPTMRLAAGGGAFVLLLINYIFYRSFSINQSREKIIAFDNPAGRVSLALVALEDLIRRTISRLPEVKEGRVGIKASKKGLSVKIRLALCSEVNIPEVTSRVQELTKRKIQDIIGLDESVNVSVYVGKILLESVKEKVSAKKKETKDQNEENFPFQGYRA
jgi:uncharacterized alkaline shock family protein YloU